MTLLLLSNVRNEIVHLKSVLISLSWGNVVIVSAEFDLFYAIESLVFYLMLHLHTQKLLVLIVNAALLLLSGQSRLIN